MPRYTAKDIKVISTAEAMRLRHEMYGLTERQVNGLTDDDLDELFNTFFLPGSQASEIEVRTFLAMKLGTFSEKWPTTFPKKPKNP